MDVDQRREIIEGKGGKDICQDETVAEFDVEWRSLARMFATCRLFKAVLKEFVQNVTVSRSSFDL